MTTKTPTSYYDDTANLHREVEALAKALDKFLADAKTSKGDPISEGMAIDAIGAVLASKAKTDEQCRKVIQDTYTAIYSSYRLRTTST